MLRSPAAVTLALSALLGQTACSGKLVGGTGAGGPADAGDPDIGDERPIDGAVATCSADHPERAEGENDPITGSGGGSAESTGFAMEVGSEAMSICGVLDLAQRNDKVIDGDVYQFDVTGSDPVPARITLVSPGRGEARLFLELYHLDDDGPVRVAGARPLGDAALLAGLLLAPGTYWVAASALYPVPDVDLAYSLSIEPDQHRCEAAAGDPDYQERSDGPQHRGNDAISILYPEFSLTESPADSPESTNLTLAPGEEGGAVFLLRGESAETSSAGDDYLDRDAFAITIGPTTSELEVRLTWPGRDAGGDVDLDLYLFAAGNPAADLSTGRGATVGEQKDETFTVRVDPDTEYWLWVAAFDDTAAGGATSLPAAYDLTLCPRAAP
jgi:hypothetical protein